ncbi:hypothetical protein GCM10022239_02900 [Leifsonia bigeumensis]|uniref:Uncharacterized protein n=1 Tax=Leifsonella bigeumensis TaxID=433643 RepID=A0ABP7F758_9MICO
MLIAEPSTAECLRLLLDEQAWRLRSLAAIVADAARHRMPELPPADWDGPARAAYDELVERVRIGIEEARSCLAEASAHSTRASATLESRG